MRRQSGVVLLWSIILLQLMMVTLLMAREGSVLAVHIAYQQQAELQRAVRLENALTLLIRQIEAGHLPESACWLEQPRLTVSELAASLPCVAADGVFYALAPWGTSDCDQLPSKPRGVRFVQVMVALQDGDRREQLVIQSSLAVPATSQATCQQGRMLTGTLQTWRKIKVRRA
jgi:hypothetical protein